jgi:hypothetical protein
MRSLPRSARRLAGALCALALAGCAAGGGPGAVPSPPPLEGVAPVSPIRDLMRPEHRVFYDMLEGLGDWALIEPYGYVFRPQVNPGAWRPYENGYWVPSDTWGWIWVSADPFGWATDHYGSWMIDRFQGWVWVPGIDWGPAWVSWVGDEDWVGWAPLSLGSTSAPGADRYVYAPISALAATDLTSRLVTPVQIGAQLGELRALPGPEERAGVTVNPGPRLEWVERRAGPLKKAVLEDVVPPGALARDRVGGAGSGGASAPAERARLLDEAQRELARAAEQARGVARSGAPAPDRVPVMRLFERRGEAVARPDRPGRATRRPGARGGAPPDSTR